MTKRFLAPLSTDHVDFNLTNPSIDATGRLRWDSNEGTLNVGMAPSGVIQQIGMEFYVSKVNNLSGVVIPAGAVVMSTGAQGDSITIAKAVGDGSIDPWRVLGIATHEIAIGGTDGLIVTQGIVRDLNTSAWNLGDLLYLSPTVAGQLTNVQPSAPAYRVPFARVLRKHENTGRIYVRMSVPSAFGTTDTNVQFGTLQNGDTITYNSSTGVWTNAQPSGGGSSVTVSDTAPSSPSQGDMWFNSLDLNTYIYYDSAWVGASGSGNTTASIYVGEVPDGNPEQGDLWFNSGNAKTYVFYDSSWVEIGGGTTSTTSIDGGEPASIFVQSIDGGSF